MKYSVIILLIVLSQISFAHTSKGDEYYQQAKDWLEGKTLANTYLVANSYMKLLNYDQAIRFFEIPSRSMIMHNHPFAFFVSEQECKDAIQITNRSREEILARNQVSIRRDVNHFQNLKLQRTHSFRSGISSFITL